MRKGRCLLVLLLVSTVTNVLLLGHSEAKASDALIRPLNDQALGERWCGCRLRDVYGEASPLYYWNDFGSSHHLNIDGKDTVFAKCEKSGRQNVKGDVLRVTCLEGSLLAHIMIKVASVCESDPCEFKRTTGRVEVVGLNRYDSMYLVGTCGCVP